MIIAAAQHQGACVEWLSIVNDMLHDDEISKQLGKNNRFMAESYHITVGWVPEERGIKWTPGENGNALHLGVHIKWWLTLVACCVCAELESTSHYY